MKKREVQMKKNENHWTSRIKSNINYLLSNLYSRIRIIMAYYLYFLMSGNFQKQPFL
jgi:hypothetical protein